MNLLDADQGKDMRSELEAKWKDKPAEELLKAKVDSDLYIKTLEARVDDIRSSYLKQQEELQTRANLQALIDQLSEKQALNSDTQHANLDAPKFDPKELETLVDTKIKANKTAETEQHNYNSIKDKLIERYGPNYQTRLEEQMSELGLTAEDLNLMARQRPRVLAKSLGLDTLPQKENFQSPPRSAQRNDSFAPKGQTKRDWNYYQELKKTSPRMYLDPKIAVQMHNDAIEQGESFYG